MQRTIVFTDRAPAAVGPYSQAVRVGDLVYTAGQIGMVPATGTIAGDTIEEQTHQVLQNLKAVLEAAGSGLDRVVKTTVFLADMDDFKRHERGLRHATSRPIRRPARPSRWRRCRSARRSRSRRWRSRGNSRSGIGARDSDPRIATRFRNELRGRR